MEQMDGQRLTEFINRVYPSKKRLIEAGLKNLYYDNRNKQKIKDLTKIKILARIEEDGKNTDGLFDEVKMFDDTQADTKKELLETLTQLKYVSSLLISYQRYIIEKDLSNDFNRFNEKQGFIGNKELA